MKFTDKQIAYFLAMLGLILNYFFDGLNKYFTGYLPSFSRIALVFRVGFQFIIMLYIFLYLNKKRSFFILIFFYFLVCFLLGNISLKYYSNLSFSLIEQFVIFNKYFFIFFLYLAIYKILNDRKLLVKLVNAYKNIFYLNGVLAIFGAIFKIRLFKIFSYSGATPRFGYTGLINAINEASVFYLLALFIIYYEWRFLKSKIQPLLVAVVFCFFTGTKAVYFGMILLFVYHILITFNFKTLIKTSALLFISLFVAVNNSDRLTTVFEYYKYRMEKLNLLELILSKRNIFIETRVIPFIVDKWSLLNYLFGGQNVTYKKSYFALTELDFIDLFLFFGVINGMFYLVIYKLYIIKKIETYYFLFVFFVLLLLAFLSGHFFYSSINPIYILITFAYINLSINNYKIVYE